MVLEAKLNRAIDGASLAVFRILFGGAMVVAALRFFTHGWIDADYEKPRVFFHYWGFGWVHPVAGMAFVYGAMAIFAALVAVGLFYRPACLAFAVTFTYAHLCDKANYLNHYYLVSLLAFLLVVLPLDRELSLRVVFWPADRRSLVPTWVLWLLRFQIGVVYTFGGIAKLGSDWLLHGEPLRIWLAANAELPVLGRFFDRPFTAIAFSVCGALFDLSIVWFLLWRKTRISAYLVVIVFHVLTSLLFNIGMFPWIMIVSATLFFDPAWPRRFVSEPNAAIAGAPARVFALGFYALAQILVPMRHFLYPGNTLWTEEGFRFSWRVMLIEKSAELELTAVAADGRRWTISPRDYLTPFQAHQASTQPDMILELAHVVARDFARRGIPVKVYADAQVSFNGRRRAPMIDPNVDLGAEADGLTAKRWILPAPETASLF